ncbi:MAG: hypothetical protein KC414_10375 [Romboutsia sp.]|nr:hypothetical protein [Romboutsia sp.]
MLVVSKAKNPELFEKITQKVIDNDLDWIVDNFNSIKEKVENISDGVFSVHNQQIILKGTNIPVPPVIYKKLQELEQKDKSKHMTSLLRFWRKLSKNPSENSREDLYDFMTRNNIPITDEGDIVVEKGVNQKVGSYPGHLVDCRTGKVDNNVGLEVFMPRDKVNPNSNETCSYGLSVAHC